MAVSKSQAKIDEEQLVHEVLSTYPTFLELLVSRYQSGSLFADSSDRMAYKVGQHDLVEDLKRDMEGANRHE